MTHLGDPGIVVSKGAVVIAGEPEQYVKQLQMVGARG